MAQEKAQEQAQQGQARQPFNMEGSRVRVFMDALFGRLGMISKINLFGMIFAFPAFVAVAIFQLFKATFQRIVPASALIGFGAPGFDVVGTQRAMAEFLFGFDFWTYTSIAIALPIIAIGLSGIFYCMRFVARGEQIKIAKTFFFGIKKCWLPFVLVSPILGGLIFILGNGISGFDFILEGHNALHIFLLVLISLVSVIAVMMAIFFFPQSVTYRQKVSQRLKYSIICALKFFPRNIFILIFTALPFVIFAAFLPSAIEAPTMLVLILVPGMLLLFSYIALLWTVYAQWAFDRKQSPEYAGEVDEPKITLKLGREVVTVNADEIEYIHDTADDEKVESDKSEINEGRAHTVEEETQNSELDNSDDYDLEEGEEFNEEEEKQRTAKVKEHKPQYNPSAPKKTASFKFSTKNKKK
ncbi:MAG: hypothetical protein FWC82_00560 [Firmicutes bacterium]|nr:hypothetical protein [Bacillota bacterium]